ncbi:MAG: YdcF family protein [Litorilinea sp.]
MLLYLSKLAPLFVYPLGLALLLIGLALLLRRRLAWRTTCEVLALVILLLFSNQSFAYGLARTLEAQYQPPAGWPDATTVVVLGGGTRVREAPRPLTEVNEAGDRLIFGAWLYQQGHAARVVVSGGSIVWLGSTTSEASGMQELLMLMGVPAHNILLEDAAQNTYDNAVYTRALLESLATEADASPLDIILVTSAMHMPRSVAIFENLGYTVLPAPVDFVTTHGDPNRTSRPDLGERFLHLLPSVEYLEISTRVLREYFGIVVYGLLGRL